MKEILIFAGTTEGRRLSEVLSQNQIGHTVCVATDYGEAVLDENSYVTVHTKRMDCDEMMSFIKNGGFSVVVDATHPYAELVTQNIQAAAKKLDVPYLRLCRDIQNSHIDGKVRYFEDQASCAKALEETDGNILLTTGSKELSLYCASEALKERLYVRILPGKESLSLCEKEGIAGKQIIALQGPFSEEMNLAMIHQYHIRCIVTKQSGNAGGFWQKVSACQKADIPIYIIGKTIKENGLNFSQICTEIEKICEQSLTCENCMEITLVGIGMGNESSLTVEAKAAIVEADLLYGAGRLIEPYQPNIEKKPYYMPNDIVNDLKRYAQSGLHNAKKVAILFSGDSGFYSGCKGVYKALVEEKEKGELAADVRIIPGISSVSYFASLIGESYQDAKICSMHGTECKNLISRIAVEEKIFMLLSGKADLHAIGDALQKAGMSDVVIKVGYQLSYPEQEIRVLSAKECAKLEKDGLYVCCIVNPSAKPKMLTHGLPDSAFIRDKVPMTKEEVREVSICKLKLHKDAIVYDIGSGTGSIAVEIANLDPSISVYAIEKKDDAVSLIEQNVAKFYLDNVTCIHANAPDGFDDLPKPTHAFVGGSGNNMYVILEKLYALNPNLRVVINAISLETIAEIKQLLKDFSITDEEVVTVQTSRSKQVGDYHLMQAENPVWICSFRFCANE